MTEPEATERPRRRRRRRPRRRWRRILAFATLAALLLVAFVAAVAWARYRPALDDARDLRASVQQALQRVTGAGLDLDRETLAAVGRDVATARERLGRIEGLLRGDPLIGAARLFPLTAAQVRGADDLTAAAGDLLEAATVAERIGERYVSLREEHGARAARGSSLAHLVELMATSRDEANVARARVRAASERVARVPDGLLPPLVETRDLLRLKLAEYSPLLEQYTRADDVLPEMLGWGGRKRYLVLAQNPAELRPTGGFIGTYGIISFEDGALVERRFRDVYTLDLKPGVPYVEPPPALKGHLLGRFPWRLADANWSPDFPTSARRALQLYSLESGDRRIDGVVGVTTFAIDEMLRVTGPVEVPEYRTTVAAGQTTLRGLQLTRGFERPRGADRKAFLDVFAEKVLARVLALPTGKWTALLDRLEAVGRERYAMAWLKDEAAQALVAEADWDGGVRRDPGDYVFAVDANVAPVSKLNLAVQRRQSLDVAIDEVGNARSKLELAWRNDVNGPGGRAYRSVPARRGDRYGVFVRVLVPERSRLEQVRGGSFVRLTAAELVGTETGRTVFGNYLMVPPGETTLTYRWTSPYAADADRHGGLYRLLVQKQPGTRDEPLVVRITAPEGAWIAEASEGLRVDGRVATLETRLREDVAISIRYRRGEASGPSSATTYTARVPGRAGHSAGGS